MNRRQFLQTSIAASFATAVRATPTSRAPRVLLRSSWQVVNIGDIAHTPGVLALLQHHIPNAEVILWASADLTPEVGAMYQRRFHKLKIVKGSINGSGRASNPALAEAIGRADFLLHGSGPSLVAGADVAAFFKHTGKPFGVYGITQGPLRSSGDKVLLSQAKFVYFRDSVSLERAKSEGVKCEVMGFAPDGAFACDLRDEKRATAFLRENGLEEGKYLCCLSRLRYTPYWLVKKGMMQDSKRHARNEAMKEHDHEALRSAIVSVVEQTGLKVLLCPEDQTQMAVGKEMFWDKLPTKVKSQVVWRDRFWLTDEALSVYVRSAGLFGSEMHSPIMAVGNGVPAIVCRFEEQTSKGFMWRDIGLGDWLFDLDRPEDHARIAPAVLEMAGNPGAAKGKLAAAQAYVKECQQRTMAEVRRAVGT